MTFWVSMSASRKTLLDTERPDRKAAAAVVVEGRADCGVVRHSVLRPVEGLSDPSEPTRAASLVTCIPAGFPQVPDDI